MAVSATNKRPGRGRTLRLSTLLVVVMILMGTLINFIPVATFYFGSYLAEPYQNTFSDGSSLVYYGTYGVFINSTGQPYSYGFKEVITSEGGSHYSMGTNVYKLTGTSIDFNINNLPASPFSATQISDVYHNVAIVTVDSNPFLSLLVPNGTEVKTPLFDASILSNNVSQLAVRPFLGYPNYHNVKMPTFNILQYVRIGTQYVMANMIYLQNFTLFFHYICPDATVAGSNAGVNIMIGSGNSVPQQDWLGWLYYGFEASLPLNAVLLGTGFIISIIRFRQMR